MGWQEVLAGMSPFMAEQSAYNNEIQNKVRQAQAQQMIQEAIQKQQMLPFDMESKSANSEYMRAMAEKMRRDATQDNEMKYADKIAKSNAAKQLQQDRQSRTMLEGVLNAARSDRGLDTGPMLDNLMEKLPEDVRSILRPSPKVNMYTDNAMETAIRLLQERDPEAAKTLRTSIQQTGQTDRDAAKIASNEKIAQMKTDAMKTVAETKKSGSKQSMENLASQYFESARTAGTPEEKNMYLELYAAAVEASKSIKAAGAQVSADLKKDTIERVLGPNQSSGTIGGGPTVKSKLPPGVKIVGP